MRYGLCGFLILLTGLAIPACNTNPSDDLACDVADPDCPEGLVCEVLTNSEGYCYAPLVIRGRVLDITDDAPITGALVQAVDVNGAAVGTSGETDDAGSFELIVPAVRDLDGVPVEGSYTLRTQAAAYQEFPTASRPALPLDAATAALDDPAWVVENALTTVKLIPLLGDTSDLSSITGSIDAHFSAGILVVAEGAGQALTGFSNSDGVYKIFNVPAGTYSVQGYAAGVQLTAATASVAAGGAVTDIDLSGVDTPLSTVSGNVQLVNAPGGSQTSVVLALESTFVEDAARGTVPPGLRVGEIVGTFTIENVPDGRYVVLAAFENDNLVRDPDQNIGGTQIVHIEVPDPGQGNTVTLSEGFKVTGALVVVSPGSDGPEQIFTPTPTFEWEDDSSEDGYEIHVFDAFGNETWSEETESVSGSETVTHTYAGPALEIGMFYQFRVTSFRERTGGRTAISTTEDLKGVFFFISTEMPDEAAE